MLREDIVVLAHAVHQQLDPVAVKGQLRALLVGAVAPGDVDRAAAGHVAADIVAGEQDAVVLVEVGRMARRMAAGEDQLHLIAAAQVPGIPIRHADDLILLEHRQVLAVKVQPDVVAERVEQVVPHVGVLGLQIGHQILVAVRPAETAVAVGVVEVVMGIDHDDLLAAGDLVHQALQVAQAVAGVDEHRLFRPHDQVHPDVAHAVAVGVEQAVQVVAELVDLDIGVHIVDPAGLVMLPQLFHVGPADLVLRRVPLDPLRLAQALDGPHPTSHFHYLRL